MEQRFEDCTEYIASISYGKDSLAMLECIKILGLPLTRIVTVDVMATCDCSANSEEVEQFKKKADKVILERYGIIVEHLRAPFTYEEQFYCKRGKRAKPENVGKIYGFPMVRGAWCNSRLKMLPIEKMRTSCQWWYVGYAKDEKKRERIEKIRTCADIRKYPLVLLDKTECDALDMCNKIGLLSPTYSSFARDGCWFCHNQTLDQLRLLRRNSPDKWKMLLRWDKDSPVTFKSNCTVHDLEIRFALEDEYLGLGLSIRDKRFRCELKRRITRKAVNYVC